MKVIAIIPSAGLGRRISSSTRTKSILPKQFLKISGKEILVHTLEKFEKAKSIDEIIISSGKDHMKFAEKLVDKHKIRKVAKIVAGGKERQHSVYNALRNVIAASNDLICVHDAVRPFISSVEIDEVVSFAKRQKSVIAAVRANDTIKTGKNYVSETLDRSSIWLIQTPQIFSFEILNKAFEKAWTENFIGTDEASIVERIGKRVYFFEVKGENRKITTTADIDYARFHLK